MVVRILILTQLLFVSRFAFASDALESSLVDAIVQSHQTEPSQVVLDSIVDGIRCSSGETEISLTGLRSGSPASVGQIFDADIRMSTDEAGQGIIIDWSSGDQVGGLYLLVADLQNSSAKRSRSIPAKFYNGFWYADGNHYAFEDVVCERI